MTECIRCKKVRPVVYFDGVCIYCIVDERDELKAARISYANLFDGDVGNIHENIRKLQKKYEDLLHNYNMDMPPGGELID